MSEGRGGENAGGEAGSGAASGPGTSAAGVLVPGGISVAVFAALYALGFAGAGGGSLLRYAAVAALALASAIGAFGPDVGMAGSPLSRALGRRGSYGSLWAERYGYDGSPTHSLAAALGGTLLVGGPAALVLGPGASAGPALAFAAGFLAHVLLDAASGRHAVRLLWPVSADRERGLGGDLGRAGGGAVSAAERRVRAWLKPSGRRGPRKAARPATRTRTAARSRPAKKVVASEGKVQGKAQGKTEGKAQGRAEPPLEAGGGMRSGDGGRRGGAARGSSPRGPEGAGG